MSLAEQTADHATTLSGGVLIVSDAADQEIRGFRSALGQAGVPFDSVSDVYAATAKLACGDWTGKVFVDVRALDDKEMAFLRLVPRFFPRCEVVVPAFEGTGDRSALRATGLSPVTVVAALDAAIAGRPKLTLSVESELVEREPAAAEIPEALLRQDSLVEEPDIAVGPGDEAEPAGPPAEAETMPKPEEPTAAAPANVALIAGAPESPPTETIVEPPPALRLSTDGGPEAAGTGPALHEAVRMRMASEDRRPIRRAPLRTPPGGTPPVLPPVAPLPDKGEVRPSGLEPMLSPDEMDALLRDDDVTADDESLPDEAEEGET